MLINSFFVFAINMFGPLYAVYVQKIDTTVLNVGGIWSFYIFGVGIFAYLVSRLESHIKYASYLLILGFLLRASGWLGYIFANEVWQLYAIQVFLALGEALGSPSYNQLFAEHVGKGSVAPEWGISMSINSIIMGIASFAGALIVYTYGFNALFAVMILLSFVSTILALKYRKLLHLTG